MVYEPREISRRVLYEKHGRGLESVIFDCGNGKKREYIIKKDQNPVCILALTCDHRVIIARQYRFGPQKVLMELPGGRIDTGETPEQAAARELREETGYAGTMTLITRAYEDGYSPMYRYCFVATDCTCVGEQELDSMEDIDVVLLSLDDFRALLRSGELTDIEVGYLGLDYLGFL